MPPPYNHEVQYPAGYDRPVASAARLLMKAIVDTFAENEIELPERQVITIGSVSVEEPLLAVMYGGLSVGTPGNEMNTPERYESPRTMSFNVELWRIDPTSESPMGASVAVTDAAAEMAMQDSWCLLEAAHAADHATFESGIVANVTVQAPQGGMLGMALALEMQVP